MSYTAWFSFKGDDYLEPFDNYFEAIEWCCIRLESVSERKEKYTRAKVERDGAVVWKLPNSPASKINPFGFAHFTVR
jgi:hypothetical protein